jgi:hypothetical protein
VNRTTRPDTAKLIKQELKATWPAVTFSVRTSRGAGVSAVDVKWTDGPTEKQVNAVVGKYEAGHFNGMIDLYEYDKERYTVDGHDVTVRYVMCQRAISEEAWAAFERLVKAYWSGLDPNDLYKLNRNIHNEVKGWDGSTTPIPQTTDELPSSIEYREWHKAYEAKMEAEALGAQNTDDDPAASANSEMSEWCSDAQFLNPPQVAAELFTPVQRESWRVW